MNRSNVILIGMSGAGKSTLGVLLAKAIGKQFIDTDLLIQQRTGKLLQQILDEEGIDAFLQIEDEVLEMLDVENSVVATGGSAVYSTRGMEHLLAQGRAVYLSVAFDELEQRLTNIGSRGIVFRGKNELRSVYEERLPLYEKYGEICIDCTGRDIESCVAELVRALTVKKRFILASKSPRRREILENLGVTFEIVTVDTDESSEERDPCRLVEELSVRKGLAVKEALLAKGCDLSDTVIISSDTVVAVDDKILGKPHDEAEACRMLAMLSGRRHRVISGISLIGEGVSGSSHEVTEVEFDRLDPETIERYVRMTQPYDKAGAYAIQGMASGWIRGIHGCYFNVVGLPVYRLNQLYRVLFGQFFL